MKRSLGMAPELVAFGHTVTLIMHDHPENRLHAGLMPNVECVFVPVGGMLSERRWKSRFLSTRAFDFIIYNSLCWRNAVLKRGLSAGALSLMEHCELESANKHSSGSRRVAQWVLEWGALWAFDGHICSSRYLLDLFKQRTFSFGLHRLVFWLPYGVDNDAFIGKDTPCIQEGPKLIYHLGTVEFNYGCFFMIHGLAALLEKRADWRARFVGKGPDLERARTLVIDLGLTAYVEFPGYVAEETMRLELARADVFLSHLNDTEQDWARCPSKLYYYMAQGRPIVTSTVGENRVALGESGFYYRPDSIEEFSRAVSEALDTGSDWIPAYTPESVTWKKRTLDFLREIESFKLI